MADALDLGSSGRPCRFKSCYPHWKRLFVMIHEEPFSFVAQDRQANGCLHTNSFAGRKNMEHEMRNVRVRNRVGVSLLDSVRYCIYRI